MSLNKIIQIMDYYNITKEHATNVFALRNTSTYHPSKEKKMVETYQEVIRDVTESYG